MKKNLLATFILGIFLNPNSFSQVNPRMEDPAYAQTNHVINSVNALRTRFCMQDAILNGTHQKIAHKKSITIGFLLTHFSHISDNNGIDSNIKFINPGIEVLFHYSLNDITCFATGLSYQYSKIIDGENSLDLNTKVKEISIPLFLSIKPLRSIIPDMELSGGFYLGQYVSIKNSFQIYGQDRNNYAKLFSIDDFIGDIYIAVGKKSMVKKIPIGLDLFFRYRLKEHQIVNSRLSRRPFYGVKFIYGFNLK